MFGRSTDRPMTVLGLALGGVLLGHAVTYRVLTPDAHARTVELAQTGHGYLGGANALGCFAAIAALSVLFLGRLVRAHDATPRVLWRLVAYQLTTFAAMEVLERLGSGAGLRQLPPVILVGLPAQVLVAALVALLVRFLVRAATVVADRAARGAAEWSVGAIAHILRRAVVAPRAPATGSPPGRAPPLLFVR